MSFGLGVWVLRRASILRRAVNLLFTLYRGLPLCRKGHRHRLTRQVLSTTAALRQLTPWATLGGLGLARLPLLCDCYRLALDPGWMGPSISIVGYNTYASTR